MNVCIIGSGLVSLTLAKALVNQGIYVDFFSNQNEIEINKSRTIGISKANVDFFNKNISDISKLLWQINKIEVYSENLKDEKILNFENFNQNLFSIVKNYELYNHLLLSLKKNAFFKFRKKNLNISIKDFKLIINCDADNLFSKKYFQKKLKKNYNSYAHTAIIDHEKFLSNNTAIQIFTKKGPIAFLPVSEFKTSVVYSVRGSRNIDLDSLIKKYNKKYSIKKINEKFSFELNAVNLRTYFFENIMAFGDLLHKLHPLAGQGFNMSIRDIKLLIELIKFRLDHGLELNSSICKDFEKKIRHKNYLFSSGVDLIYEFFNLESKFNNSILSKSVQLIGKNKYTNKFLTKLANDGIVI